MVLLAPFRFGGGQAGLTAKLRADVAMMAQRARGREPLARIIIEAYADAPGDTPAHQKLAVRRADAIRQAFVEAGIRSDLVTAAAGNLDDKRAPGVSSFDVHVRRAKPDRPA